MIEILSTSYPGRTFPHLARLMRSNPGVKVHLSPDGVKGAKDRNEGWRNCDRQIRDWWKESRHLVKSQRIVHVEWDVVVNQDLQEIDVGRSDLAGRKIETHGSLWPWWNERELLPPELRSKCQGMAPCAVLFFSRECLDRISAPEWDEVFEMDIISEIRLPTVAYACGMTLRALPELKEASNSLRLHPFDRKGIYHAVKTPHP